MKISTKVWDEKFAKLLLSNLMADEFSNLIISDKPDLQNNKWGIEVTQAELRNRENHYLTYYEDLDLASRVCNKKICDVNKKDKNKIKKYDLNVISVPTEEHSSIIGHPAFYPNNEKIIDSFKIKLEKLKNYKNFENYGLFLFYHDTCLSEDEIKTIVNELNLIQKTYDKKISKIFITMPSSIVWICDLINEKIIFINIYEYDEVKKFLEGSNN